MYLGIKIYDYNVIDSIELKQMYWDSKGSNYLAHSFQFIDKYFSIELVLEFHIKVLLSLILENVHDHGSSSCVLKYGKRGNDRILEVFEENGGFDLTRLPYGTGGCLYREIKRSNCKVSHSSDGKRTFVLIN